MKLVGFKTKQNENVFVNPDNITHVIQGNGDETLIFFNVSLSDHYDTSRISQKVIVVKEKITSVCNKLKM